MRKVGLITVMSLLLTVAACPVYSAKPSSHKKHSAPQLTYSLPKTTLAIEVTLTRTEIKAGPYCNYGKRYLALDDVATEDKVLWTLNEISVKPVGEADKDKTFQMKSPGSIVVNRKGVICGLNVDGSKVENDGDSQSEPIVTRMDDNNFNPSAYYEDQLEAVSIGRMAECAAKQIYRIRDSRTSLATGDMERMPADGESMRQMFDEMDREEKDLMALFEGKKRVTEVKKVIVYIPSKKSVKDELVFRVSKSGGVVDKDDLTGAPVYLSITAKKNDMPSAQLNGGNLYYNVPGTARVQLTYNNQLMFDADMQIAQLGSTQALPSSFSKAQLHFDPNTGALLNVFMPSKK